MRPRRGADHSPPFSAAVMEGYSSEPHRACNGITLPLIVIFHFASTNVIHNTKLTLTSKVLINRMVLFFLFMVLQPNASYDLLISEVSRSHTTTHHSR